MPSTTPADLAAMTPEALTLGLAGLLGDERAILVAFLQHLAELERRKLHLDHGYSSLFSYLTDHLRLPKASAYRRMTAARLLARIPSIAPCLADGRLCLTTLCLLKDVLSETTAEELLARASGKTEDEVQLLVASLRPKPALPDLIRALPARPAARELAPAAPLAQGGIWFRPEPTASEGAPVVAPPGVPPPASPAPGRPPAKVTPLSEELRVIRMTVGREFMAELEDVKAALSHRVPPGASLECLLRECYHIALQAISRRRRGGAPRQKARRAADAARRDQPGTSAPSAAPERAMAKAIPPVGPQDPCAARAPAGVAALGELPAARSRYIPVAVRRAVWERDDGRCAFVGTNGKRCASRDRLELHHRVPFAAGGEATVDACSLACRAHNIHQARRDFGDELMDRFSRKPQERPSAIASPQLAPLDAARPSAPTPP